MSKITIDITNEILDELIVESLKEMYLCLQDRTDMEAFELVINFYESAK